MKQRSAEEEFRGFYSNKGRSFSSLLFVLFFLYYSLLVSNYSKDQWKVHSLFYYKKILLFFNLILHNLFLNILYNDICVLFQSVVRFILFDISVFLFSLFFFRNKLVSFRIRKFQIYRDLSTISKESIKINLKKESKRLVKLATRRIQSSDSVRVNSSTKTSEMERSGNRGCKEVTRTREYFTKEEKNREVLHNRRERGLGKGDSTRLWEEKLS